MPSEIANTIEEGLQIAKQIGYPVVLRPAFTLGGTGGGFADDEKECAEILKNALTLSPVHQVLVEKSIKGFKEIEYEVMRDANDTAITVCNMENLDPVGIHKLIQTLTKECGYEIPMAVKMLTEIPAKILKIDDKKGVLATGKDADIIVFDEEIKITDVFVGGEKI